MSNIILKETGLAVEIPNWLKFVRSIVRLLPFPSFTPGTQVAEIIFVQPDGSWVKYKAKTK